MRRFSGEGSVWLLSSPPPKNLLAYCRELWAIEGIIWLFMLFLKLFGNVRPESVSFYFSAYENRELHSRSTFIRSTFAEDIMLCARGCGAESDCNTANYNSEGNKCELFKERMENISHGAAVITTRGYYLLTKVRINSRLFNYYI